MRVFFVCECVSVFCCWHVFLIFIAIWTFCTRIKWITSIHFVYFLYSHLPFCVYLFKRQVQKNARKGHCVWLFPFNVQFSTSTFQGITFLVLDYIFMHQTVTLFFFIDSMKEMETNVVFVTSCWQQNPIKIQFKMGLMLNYLLGLIVIQHRFFAGSLRFPKLVKRLNKQSNFPVRF